MTSLVALPLLSLNCKKTDESPSAESTPGKQTASRGTIGLSVLTLTNPFFKDIADNMTSEAARHGYEVLVNSGEFDAARQRDQVKDFIVRQVSAIVLTPCDSKAVGTVIKEANTAGIPVFTADIACLDPDARVVCHIATDNYQGGCQAARALHEALGGRGRVAVIDHPEVESVLLRTKGFDDELRKLKSDIVTLGRWPGKGSKDESFKTTQEILQAHPDLNGIFAINDPSALGAYAALEIAGKTDRVTLIGFDGQPEGKKAIREGKILADPIQFPDRIGRETVRTIMKYFEGESVPPEILIPTQLYTKADAQNDPLFQP